MRSARRDTYQIIYEIDDAVRQIRGLHDEGALQDRVKTFTCMSPEVWATLTLRFEDSFTVAW